MRIIIIHQINERYVMEEKEINCYKNKTIDLQILQNYLETMLNYRIN